VISRRLSSKAFFIILIACVLFIPSSSTEITEPIRDGDYIYIDDSKAYLKGTYSVTHGKDIEHWAMTKQFTGDCDMAIGFDGEVAWPTKVLLEDPHYVYWDTDISKTFYYVTNFAPTTDTQDYGNWYNLLKYKFNHKIFIGYDNTTNESVWQDVIGTVAYFDSQVNDGTNYTITWHTEHSRLEQYRDISNRILATPIEYEFDGKNLWFVTKNIPMTANEMRKIVIEMDGKIELGEQSYKYDIIWKPSFQTLAEARTAKNLYVLDPYLNVSYPFRVGPIYLNRSVISGTQNNFPFQLYKYVEGFAGYHPVVTVNGTRVPCENESYSNNNLSVWYKANISNITNPEIYVYASPDLVANDSTYGSHNVWNDNYVGVWHMNDDPTGTVYDSTSNNNDGTSGGSMTSGDLIDLDYGKAIIFDSNDYINVGTGTDLSGTSACTLITRYKLTVSPTTTFMVIADRQKELQVIADDELRAAYYIGGGWNTDIDRTIDWTKWYTHSTRYDGFNIYNHENDLTPSSIGDSGTFGYNSADHNMYFNRYTGGLYGQNTISEIRILNSATSNGYISTTHKNLNNPTTTGTAPFYNSTGEIQYYVNSIHYNSTNPYNLTVESDSTLTSNRSIVVGDDINDTAQSTGTSYLIVTQFSNSASIVRNFTFTGDDIDWYQAANLSGSYSLKNSTGTIQTVADGNFTVDIVAGDYWVESAGVPIVTLLSMTPSTICQNCTGNISIEYGISHSSVGLNNTSVSFIYRDYDYDLSDSNHSIRPPANDFASDWNFDGRILRGANRNESLNFENNATITGGDIYTWSGLDENNTRLIIVPVNSTYTKVYINGTIHDVMPQMWYLDRTDLQESTKTQLAIHKTQNVLIKFWNFEIFKGNTDFLGVGYTDTALNTNPALHPSDANPVNFYYVNSSYNPATGGDPLTSGYAVYMGSLNASGWVDHVYSPHTNSSYVRGFINNTLLETYINTTNISYLLFTSDTPSSKSFYINMTDVASPTNISYANTNVLWVGDTAPFTPQSYTPNVWFSFMKLNMSLDHKLYVADNNDNWANSTMNRTNITSGLFPPTAPSFYAFHNGFQDFDMNGTYHDTIQIQVSASSDPDGGVVTHNITLHYGNKTYVATINGSAVAEDGVYTNISFNTTPYYSQTENYTLRVIATDDESESVTVWLGVNFSLDGSPQIISYSPSTPVTSTSGDTQTFSITTNILGNVTWYLDSVEVFNETSVTNSSYSNSTAAIGTYNVTVITTNTNGSNSMTWDWTVTLPKGRIPLSIFMGIGGVILVLFVSSLIYVGIPAIFTSFLGMMLAFINSQISVNGQLVQNVGGFDGSGNVIQGTTVIEVPALSYLFIFMGLIMAGITIYHIIKEFKYKKESEYEVVEF